MTKHTLESMNEEEFRKHLIELFRRMGYKDVDHFHGPRELGKDIIMWQETASGERIHIACVVKAGKITGSASKRSSAGEVGIQVQQAFGSIGLDPHLKSFKADKVFVVCNSTISTSARDSLKAIFDGNPRAKDIEFYSLERIWELTEKHFGPQALWARFSQARYGLLRLGGDHYDLRLESTENFQRIHIQEKYEGASKDNPITAALFTKFPSTAEGKERLEQFKEALAGRAEFSLKKDELIEFKMTGALQELFEAIGYSAENFQRLDFKPIEQTFKEHRGAILLTNENSRIQLNGFNLRWYRYGHFLCLSASGGPFLIKLKIKTNQLSSQHPEIGFELAFNRPVSTSKQFKDWLDFLSVLSNGATFQVDDYDRGQSFPFLTFPSQTNLEPPPLWLKRFAENVVTINQKLGTEICFSEDLTEQDIINASEVASLLRNDQIYSGEFSIRATEATFENSALFVDRFRFYIWHNEILCSIMNQEITLPERLTIVEEASLKSPELIQQSLPLKPNESIEVKMLSTKRVQQHFKGLSPDFYHPPGTEDTLN